MKRVPRARLDVDDRKRQLLALGIELFSKDAYDVVSIDEVARKAGISKGLLYHYFPTKRDFYLASLEVAAQELLERTVPDASLPPIERARAALDAYLAYVEKHAKPYAALLRSGVGSDPEANAVVERTRALFLERMLEGVEDAPITPRLRTALRGWIGFVEAASLDWVEHGDLSREELGGQLADTLFRAVEIALGLVVTGHVRG